MSVYLKLNGIEINCDGTERWGDLLCRLPDGGAGALGVSVRGRTQSLNDPVEEYAFARVLTYADEEGRRIYERSLQFLFLTAADRLYPGRRVRIRHSFAQGLYIDLPTVAVKQDKPASRASTPSPFRALPEYTGKSRRSRTRRVTAACQFASVIVPAR